MKLTAKRIEIGNAINVELYEMTERALKLLGNIDSSNIDAFEDHFMKNEKIKEGSFGRRIVREHIVQFILEEFTIEAFGVKCVVEKNASQNSKGSSGRWKN